jgi:hypothetical protein
MLSTETWTVEIQLFEGDDLTTAKATLISGSGSNRRRTVQGSGRSHRKPTDADIAEIGAEIASARALRDLADRLLMAASEDISALEAKDVHLTH